MPATIKGTFSAMLHETHPDQFGMTFLAEYIWWPHIYIYREIYNLGTSCNQCLKAGKNFKEGNKILRITSADNSKENKIFHFSFSHKVLKLTTTFQSL